MRQTRRDISNSDLAGLEHQHAWFAELHSKIGDNRNQDDDGDVFVGFKWAIVGMVIIVAGISSFVWWMR